MEAYSEMFKQTGSFLNAMEEVQPPPLHSTLSDQWWTTIEKELDTLLKESESPSNFIIKTNEVLECFRIGHACFSNVVTASTPAIAPLNIQAHIDQLIAKPQSEQRTEEWYREMETILTASEFYQLFGSPRARGLLVMSKIQNQGTSQTSQTPRAGPRKACLTEEMSPLDWGIRFEPVAKQVLEARWKAQITELGRLRHPTLQRLAASPDGLITKTESPGLLGHLVEIKCPSSRSVGNGVPQNYWYQMQLQLEVTGCDVCEYCEFTFDSAMANSTMDIIPESCADKGVIILLQNDSLGVMKYIYGPIGDMEWKPQPEEGWDVLERIPWCLEKEWIHSVSRDTQWFQSVIPLLNEFWADVERAKRGEFTAPESTSRKKQATCIIADSD